MELTTDQAPLMIGTKKFDLEFTNIPGTRNYTVSSRALKCERVVAHEWLATEILHMLYNWYQLVESGE